MESLDMIYLNIDIVKHLMEIEGLCKKRNIPTNKVTLILRDPRENMIVLLTTEKTSDDVRSAVETALRQVVIA